MGDEVGDVHYQIIYFTHWDVPWIMRDDPVMTLNHQNRFLSWSSMDALDQFCGNVVWSDPLAPSKLYFGMYPFAPKTSKSMATIEHPRKSQTQEWVYYAEKLIEFLFADGSTAGSSNNSGYSALACDLTAATEQLFKYFDPNRTDFTLRHYIKSSPATGGEGGSSRRGEEDEMEGQPDVG